jgi:hypothetical protein
MRVIISGLILNGKRPEDVIFEGGRRRRNLILLWLDI